MEISVIGAGYVGLTTAACLAELGHKILCADRDTEKLELLKKEGVPFYEPHLTEVVKRNRAAGRLEFTSTEEAIDGCKVLFICVGTPPLESGEADLSAIEHLARVIAERARGYRLVIEKSTVPVQTGRQLQRHLGFYSANNLQYDVVSNPEFLREGCAVEDFFHPDRIVVGAETSRAADFLKQIYAPILDGSFVCPVHQPACARRGAVPFVLTDINSAELIKHASNSFLAMKISFINIVADLCEVAHGDIKRVAEGIGLDRRIGPAFLRPGIGFGGFCFPKDLQAFIRIAEKFGCDFSLLAEVEKINRRRIDLFVEKAKKELWVLRSKTIALWGLAFKPDTDDIRFAPSLGIIQRLLAEGCKLRAYDPQAMANARKQFPEVTYCKNVYEAAQSAAAILVLTEWDEFRRVEWHRVRAVVDRPLIIDGRNVFSREEVLSQGFEYSGVGIPPADRQLDPGVLSV
jgi:UDPglucose 6-dehydrogenase